MESLGVDFKLLIAQITNFLLFFFILKKFIAKPFSKFLINEKNKEDEKERILLELKQKEENFVKEKNQEITKLNVEQQKILKELKEEMRQMRERMITEAKKEARVIIEKSKKHALQYEEKINRQIDEKVKNLSLKIIADILSNVMTPQLHKEVNQQMVKSLDKLKTELRKNIN